MLSQERLDYFLNTKYDELKNDEYQELVENYFTVKKDNWSKISKNSFSSESNEEIEFWKLIRMHTMIRGKQEEKFVFNNFIFPPSIRGSKLNFWSPKEKRIFEREVNFTNCTFEGAIDFEKVIFKDTVYFLYVDFKKLSNFKYATFEYETFFIESTFVRTNFHKAIFRDSICFSDVTFNGYSDFSKTLYFGFPQFDGSKFYGTAQFHSSKYRVGVSFLEAEFNENFEFSNSSIKGNTIFKKAKFIGDTYFIKTLFSGNVEFTDAVFATNNKVLFEYILGEYFLDFSYVKFSSNIVLRAVNCDRIDFYNSDINELEFRDCEWGNFNRIRLKGGTESMYRQLKRNFANSKDWELAGKAYVSEISERQKRYYSQFGLNPFKNWNARLSYLFFKIYEILGLYTQSFIRPFLWVCFFTIFFFPLLIYSDWCLFKPDCEFSEDILKYSFKNAIPFYKLEDNQFFWWQLFQKILSTMLITFFILALRKRFKQ